MGHQVVWNSSTSQKVGFQEAYTHSNFTLEFHDRICMGGWCFSRVFLEHLQSTFSLSFSEIGRDWIKTIKMFSKVPQFPNSACFQVGCFVAELVERKPELILDICPEKGLDVQNFTCAECRKPFPMDDPNVWESHIRLCEYNGRYFCTVCHRNNAKLTPGNVIKNWDFSPRLVCRESKQLLTLLHFHPILPVLDINKELLVQVEELNRVEEVRGRLAILNRMMLDCVEGPQIALLHLLPSHRKHLMVRNQMYSMNDLVDIERGVLVEELGLFMGELERHVKVTCVSCMGKAQVCVVCWSVTDRLFAFEEAGKVCDKCGAVMHRRCVRNVGDCPNCQGKGRNMGSVVD